ncbi:hypothetical protein KAK06_13455 [Ideonella sp. 4Y11]|uniref:Uncharacterized protein n=1 Tax=Ideonella aquatica TaxID=2824119 RepID=A0A941BLQ1_9BURK|nr:hypothetical protein [Ideonella aquatica]MBQ0959954.1 hypothetical protein [Ideonella aquatica]
MKIHADPSITPSPGDFGARVDGAANTLLVAPALAEFARRHHLVTAEALAGFASAFPSALASSLSWRAASVLTAVQGLNALMASNGVPVGEAQAPRRKRVLGLG